MVKRNRRNAADGKDENAWATSSAEARKQRVARQRRASESQREPSIASPSTGVDARSPIDTKVKEPEADSNGVVQLPTPSPTPMPASHTLPLLVCSVGNPGAAYANTLHNAGHTVLKRLADHLGWPAFQKDKAFGKGLVSKDGRWTLWQSTAYMNESGRGVRAAWQQWSKEVAEGEGKLVVLHDELERPLGAVTLRTTQGASAKGHNGLKSIMSTMGNTPFARIGIGIGRPISRDSEDVARYVLKQMTGAERDKLEGSVEEVVQKLQQIERV